MNINTAEICPSCNGTGKISSTLITEDEIEKNLKLPDHAEAQRAQHRSAHPILYAYLTKGIPVLKLAKWHRKYKQRIKLEIRAPSLPGFISSAGTM